MQQMRTADSPSGLEAPDYEQIVSDLQLADADFTENQARGLANFIINKGFSPDRFLQGLNIYAGFIKNGRIPEGEVDGYDDDGHEAVRLPSKNIPSYYYGAAAAFLNCDEMPLERCDSIAGELADLIKGRKKDYNGAEMPTIDEAMIHQIKDRLNWEVDKKKRGEMLFRLTRIFSMMQGPDREFYDIDDVSVDATKAAVPDDPQEAVTVVVGGRPEVGVHDADEVNRRLAKLEIANTQEAVTKRIADPDGLQISLKPAAPVAKNDKEPVRGKISDVDKLPEPKKDDYEGYPKRLRSFYGRGLLKQLEKALETFVVTSDRKNGITADPSADTLVTDIVSTLDEILDALDEIDEGEIPSLNGVEIYSKLATCYNSSLRLRCATQRVKTGWVTSEQQVIEDEEEKLNTIKTRLDELLKMVKK